jgi:hypothetical protein
VQFRRVVRAQLDGQHGASDTSFIGAIARSGWRRPPAVAEAVIEEARRRARQRRRRWALIAAGALLACGAYVLVARAGDGPVAPAAWNSGQPILVPSTSALAKQPYVGVSCPEPNSIACDRIGIGVWTRAPASSIDATIAGHTIRLDDESWTTGRGGVFVAGYLQVPGLLHDGPLAVKPDRSRDRWIGTGQSVETDLRLVFTGHDGLRRATTVRIQLAAGWG